MAGTIGRINMRKELTILDNIEVLKVEQQRTDFPEHYHDTFCISLIEQGLEAIKMGDATILSEKGTISITNPLEIHANPIPDKSIVNSFTTIYISPDIASFFLQKKEVIFSHQQLSKPQSIKHFQKIVKAISNIDIKEIEQYLNLLLRDFETKPIQSLDDMKQADRKWRELMLFIDSNLENKVTLDLLAKFMNMNKFNFAKEFRAKNGLSPINYVMMKKIFKAKDLISKTTKLTQLAYRFEFSDQAHFSKQFKRFVGISPRAYKAQLL